MKPVFGERLLEDLQTRRELPEVDTDDAAIIKAIRLSMNDKMEQAVNELSSLTWKHRVLFEGLITGVPTERIESKSESTFVVNYVGPVLNGLFKHDLKIIMHYPNTECAIQKSQGLEANRADIVAQIRDHEVMFGEVTGPAQVGNAAKNHWDLYRLARFGKSFLQAGNKLAPLVQLLHAEGTYYTMSDKMRGIFLMEKVASFHVPTSKAELAQFLVTLPALYALKDDLETIKNEDVNALKRSWGYADVPSMKKRTK
ncbi:hypothetical protein BGZ98_001785 [Dissophora globulifera]|nr:hypothetical protein BGZ98_001785 [Dissophora globulifera]